ncbi:MAG TPA: hypothetical protein VGG39_35795 [Polyangiaceae bacterium]|jgi:hypothetical protein
MQRLARPSSLSTRPFALRAKPLDLTSRALRCRRKFLRAFPGGFADETYVDWERGYKAAAHERWERELGRGPMEELLAGGKYLEIAKRAVAIESRTNLLFSFEKMALRDAVREKAGARAFAEGLHAFLHRPLGEDRANFERWAGVVAELPRRQTRVFTWPVVTVFGFIAVPKKHIFLKPRVTAAAARAYGAEFTYASRPSWPTYESLLRLAHHVKRDVADLRPRDMIDLQSFLWVQGSDEYEGF